MLDVRQSSYFPEVSLGVQKGWVIWFKDRFSDDHETSWQTETPQMWRTQHSERAQPSTSPLGSTLHYTSGHSELLYQVMAKNLSSILLILANAESGAIAFWRVSITNNSLTLGWPQNQVASTGTAVSWPMPSLGRPPSPSPSEKQRVGNPPPPHPFSMWDQQPDTSAHSTERMVINNFCDTSARRVSLCSLFLKQISHGGGLRLIM